MERPTGSKGRKSIRARTPSRYRIDDHQSTVVSEKISIPHIDANIVEFELRNSPTIHRRIHKDQVAVSNKSTDTTITARMREFPDGPRKIAAIFPAGFTYRTSNGMDGLNSITTTWDELW